MGPDALFHLSLGPPALPAPCCRCACAQPNLCPAFWTHCRPMLSFCLQLLPSSQPAWAHPLLRAAPWGLLLGSVLGQLPAHHAPKGQALPVPWLWLQG